MRLAHDRQPARTYSEWASREPCDVALTPPDWSALETLQGQSDRPLLIEPARDGLQVSTYSWVGTVGLPSVDFQITPKLVGGELGVLTMLGYVHGQDAHAAVRRTLGTMGLPPRGNSLVDLIGLLLATECERLIGQGLIHRFVEREGPLPYLRGRLLALPHIRKHYSQIVHLECRYDDFDSDVLENQWLSAGVRRALEACRSRPVRQRLMICRDVLSEACDDTDFDVMKTYGFEYQRDNAHYRDGHAWADLFLRRQRLSRMFSTGPRSYAFMLDMNAVFEQFVGRLVIRALEPIGGFRVALQRRDHSIVAWADSGRPYQAVIPDMIVSAPGGHQLPIDSKYKLYDDRKLDPSDVYQLFAYAYAFSGSSGAPTAVVIYPTSSSAFQHAALDIRSHDVSLRPARISILGIPVVRALASLDIGQEAAFLMEMREHLLQMWVRPPH